MLDIADGSPCRSGHSTSDIGSGLPPSVLEPERFTGARPAYIFGEASGPVSVACFPESHPPAVLLPESFQGRLLLRRRVSAGLSRGDHLYVADSLPRLLGRSTFVVPDNPSGGVLRHAIVGHADGALDGASDPRGNGCVAGI